MSGTGQQELWLVSRLQQPQYMGRFFSVLSARLGRHGGPPGAGTQLQVQVAPSLRLRRLNPFSGPLLELEMAGQQLLVLIPLGESSVVRQILVGLA